MSEPTLVKMPHCRESHATAQMAVIFFSNFIDVLLLSISHLSLIINCVNANQDGDQNERHLGDNCIQNFHLGRYNVGYTVGNLVLRRRASGAVKLDFRTYIRQYTSPNENIEYGNPHSNALLQFEVKSERCKPHKAARHPTKCDVINDVKLFRTVYRRIYCRKFFDVILSDVALQSHIH